MHPQAVRAYVNRHHIPSKREFGKTYYSKQHIDELKRVDLATDERYMTVEDVRQQYGLTAANISHIVRVNKIGNVKVGVKNLLLKSDVERVMNERKMMFVSISSFANFAPLREVNPLLLKDIV